MAQARAEMVARQLRAHGIVDERVLAAMAAIPREEFLPPSARALAYEDRAIPIGFGQTISQPLVVASMTQALRLQDSDRVLEVGSGSGYQAAVLARLCAHLVTIELEPRLADRAREALARIGGDNVEVVTGDGRLGWPPGAPYQAVLVAAAPAEVPSALLEQLDEGGRMVVPIGPEAGDQELRLITRRGGELRSRALFAVRFVPLRAAPPA